MEREKLLVRIEVPFCTGHCLYCEKKTYGQNVGMLQRYRRALEKEIQGAREEMEMYDIVSVHVEACVPSLFGIGAWDDFLRGLRERIPGSPEWVVNLLPQELTPEMIHVVKNRQRIDRIYLGLGAFSQETLRSLHRPYTQNLAEHALSFLSSPEGEPLLKGLVAELFLGIPGQTPEEFLLALQRVADLAPSQITLKRFRNRSLSLQEQVLYAEETPWDAYLSPARELLLGKGYGEGKSAGMVHFYRPGMLLKENTKEAASYSLMGFGLGACTSFEGVAYQNTRDLGLYLEHSGEPDKIAVFA